MIRKERNITIKFIQGKRVRNKKLLAEFLARKYNEKTIKDN